MNTMVWIGRVAGIVGVLLGVVAIVSRVQGRYLVGAFQVGTLFEAGATAMVFGCYCFLLVLTDRLQGGR